MCHLGLGLLEIETTNKAVIQNMNKLVLAWAERLWDTHVEDHSGGWQYSIEYLTRSSTCQRPAVVERFVCRWVGLYGEAEGIFIGSFEHRYDPNSMKKEFVNENEPKLFIRTESS
jgi:hypothetical protein